MPMTKSQGHPVGFESADQFNSCGAHGACPKEEEDDTDVISIDVALERVAAKERTRLDRLVMARTNHLRRAKP